MTQPIPPFKYLTDVNPPGDELLARTLDVRDGQKQTLDRTGRRGREVHAELD
ncbi:MAG: hypothetical protein JO145_11050 [Acidobacteriaceae bacterium]|nr:hypothetical protein [Acidobacteriaceae bacterium]